MSSYISSSIVDYGLCKCSLQFSEMLIEVSENNGAGLRGKRIAYFGKYRIEKMDKCEGDSLFFIVLATTCGAGAVPGRCERWRGT